VLLIKIFEPRATNKEGKKIRILSLSHHLLNIHFDCVRALFFTKNMQEMGHTSANNVSGISYLLLANKIQMPQNLKVIVFSGLRLYQIFN
jgi:hypothetical protein